MLFELNCGYYPWMLYEEEVNSRFKSKSTDELLVELRELMSVCQKNFHHAHKFQKQAHNKGVKSWSYAPSKKILLNRKYIKTKRNQK